MTDPTKILSESDTKKPKGKRPPRAGQGRPKGVQNKVTREVKQMILDALDMAGGVEYLAAKAESHPAPFLALVAKVLPLQVTGENGGAIQVSLQSEDSGLL